MFFGQMSEGKSAGLTLNDLYDTSCMIRLFWLCKIRIHTNLMYKYLYDANFENFSWSVIWKDWPMKM